MKKFKIFIYIVLIIIIGVLAFLIFKNVNKNNNENSDEKSISEIKYMETELVNLLNTINNIESRNYKISVGKMPDESEGEKSTESSQGGESSSASGGSQGGDSSSGSGGSQGGNSSSGSGSSQEGQTSSDESLNSGNESEQDNQKFELKSSGVLTNDGDVNWDIVKSGVENLYLSIPTITIDLYNQNVNQDEVLSFNKEYDNLAVVVKDEKKTETLAQLSKVYDYLPKFVSQEDILYKTLVETKSNIFKAYSKLDDQKWDEISDDIKNAIDSYSKLLTNTNIDSNKQYSINKGYIMINELQNAVAIKDTSVFLIKYKNLIEEINNI